MSEIFDFDFFDYEEKRDQYVEQVEELLSSKQYAKLRDMLLPLEPADIALLLEEADEEYMPLLYRLLPKELAAEVFVELESDSQEMLINGFSNAELKEVLDELYLDDAVDIIEEMPASVVIRILDRVTPEMRKSMNEILQYPEDSAGSIMNMEFLSLKKDMTVADAFKRIRRIGGDMETINMLYVTDPQRKLLGVLSVRDLLLAEEDDLIEDLMDPNLVWATTMDDKEDVAQALSKYDFLAMPIVDKENRLVGIVTVDDAMDVIEEETTEDFEKMAAMLPSDKPYLRAGVFDTWKARLPWLMILMLSATFTGLILNHYESKLAACLVLNAYIPMLSGTGGNSGTQASVAVIRALSLDEVYFSDVLKVLWKELRVSFLCGLCLACANFAKMLLIDRMLLGNDEVTTSVCLVVCLTILFVVVFAKCVGCSLPILAEKIGLDPAVMASPFITTIVDATSLLIYFNFASSLLGI
ncbi:MAG: magnesium transporter [Ruminococcaceae bacterium]|nr:magnesium transporter [Oscillospiraceae bacterium]